jgi:uncharacterized protein (TIGR02246 family)
VSTTTIPLAAYTLLHPLIMENENVTILSTVDDASVESIYRELINSWNQTDSKMFADMFAKDGSIVGFDGSQANGQDEIYKHLTGIFNDPQPATFVTIVEEIRWLDPGVALLRAVAGMVPRGKTQINPQTNTIQSLIVTKNSDGWKISLFQNTPAAFHGRPELSEELTCKLQKQFDSKNKEVI